MCAAPTTYLGLERLIPLEKVLVKQKPGGFFAGNKYVILAPEGEMLLKAKEDGIVFGGHNRGFDMYLQNPHGDNVVHFRRPYTFGVSKLEVSVGGKVVSIIREKPTFVDTVVFINDANDLPVLRVKGTLNKYELQTPNKVCIGSVKKEFGGLIKEVFTKLDDYCITFPRDLHVYFKTAVVGACIFIDYLK